MNRKALTLIITLNLFGHSLLAATDSNSIADNMQKPVEKVEKPQNQEPKSQLIGFQEWKQERVEKAKEKLEAFKSPDEISVEQASEGETSKEVFVENAGEKPSTPEAQADRLRQLEFNLEIALSLTIHDYFSLYLKSKNRAELTEVVQKLKPDELSELLMSYRDRLEGPSPKLEEPATPKNQNL